MLAVFLMFITFVYNFVAPLIKKLNILKDSIGKKQRMERGFTVNNKLRVQTVCSCHVTYACTVQISIHNTAQPFCQFGQMVECSFTN